MAQQTLNTPRETTHQRIADALEDIVDKIVDTSSASNIDYDNTQSGLNADKAQGAIDELAEEKVDKETGKGLSTNDYTDADKNKLADIEAEANKTVVDSAMSDRSTNPLQNRVITVAFDEKTDVNNFNALTQEFDLFNTYDLTNDVEISVFANETYKRDKYYDRSYETHIPNLDGEYSVSLGDKTFTETCTFTIANEGKSITEVFHTNSKYILGAKLLKAENDEVGDAHVIADVVTLLISKDAPYTTTFDPSLEHPPVTGVLTLKVSVKPDEKYVDEDNYAYWGSYNGSDLLINNPILTYSEITFGQPKVSGNPITIESSESNLVECKAEVEAVQDLHGYDKPWVGGAGKNKFNAQKIVTDSNHPNETYIENGYLKFRTGNVVSIGFVWDSINLSCPLTFHGKVKNFGNATNNVRMDVTYSDNSTERIIIANGLSALEEVSFSVVIGDSGKTLSQMKNAWTNELRAGFDISTTQLEAGNQATSYEPYSNICPISGWDEVNVTRTGKNIANMTYGDKVPSISTGKMVFSDGWSSDFCKLDKNTKYVLSSNFASRYRYVLFYDKDKTYLGYTDNYSATGYVLNDSTYWNNTSYIKLRVDADSTATMDVQLEVGSTATAYEPYNGKTYTIQLKDEQGNPLVCYGGSLDVVSGELRVTHGIVDLGDLRWTYRDGIFYSASLATIIKSDVPVLCSCYTYDSEIVQDKSINIHFYYNPNSINVRDSSYTDATDFKTAVTGQTLVYELAIPYTIKLTPQQIRLLKGTNNISCNTGDLTIKYYPDNVLGQLKGDIEDEYDDRVETLETQVQELQPSLIFMSRERRDITSDLSRLSIAVAEQNLEKYGYKIGDYFQGIESTPYTYILADYNTFKGTSTPYCLTQNHLGIIVDTHTTSQWHSGDASSVGYNGSTLHTYLKDTVMNNIKADMIALFGGSTGLEHLLSHSKLLTTALTNWGWQANQYISALSEVQTIGSVVWGANGYQTGEASKKLELFDKYKWTEIFKNEYSWLRDMSFASDACLAYNNGAADDFGVTGSFVAVGLINFY